MKLRSINFFALNCSGFPLMWRRGYSTAANLYKLVFFYLHTGDMKLHDSLWPIYLTRNCLFLKCHLKPNMILHAGSCVCLFLVLVIKPHYTMIPLILLGVALSSHWLRSVSTYGVTRAQWLTVTWKFSTAYALPAWSNYMQLRHASMFYETDWLILRAHHKHQHQT